MENHHIIKKKKRQQGTKGKEEPQNTQKTIKEMAVVNLECQIL